MKNKPFIEIYLPHELVPELGPGPGTGLHRANQSSSSLSFWKCCEEWSDRSVFIRSMKTVLWSFLERDHLKNLPSVQSILTYYYLMHLPLYNIFFPPSLFLNWTHDYSKCPVVIAPVSEKLEHFQVMNSMKLVIPLHSLY